MPTICCALSCFAYAETPLSFLLAPHLGGRHSLIHSYQRSSHRTYSCKSETGSFTPYRLRPTVYSSASPQQVSPPASILAKRWSHRGTAEPPYIDLLRSTDRPVRHTRTRFAGTCSLECFRRSRTDQRSCIMGRTIARSPTNFVKRTDQMSRARPLNSEH